MPTIVISENSGADYTGVTDTEIRSTNPTTNYISGAYMEATSWAAGDNTRSIISIVPPSLGIVTVSSATLEIRQESITGSATRTIDLHKLLRGNASATWDTQDGTNAWQVAGATGALDSDSAALVSLAVTVAIDYKSWSNSALATYVQEQMNAGNPMLFLLTRSPLASPPQDTTANNFSASQDTDGNRPRLTIVYTLNATTPPVGASIF
jgi:hypothetical protein